MLALPSGFFLVVKWEVLIFFCCVFQVFLLVFQRYAIRGISIKVLQTQLKRGARCCPKRSSSRRRECLLPPTAARMPTLQKSNPSSANHPTTPCAAFVATHGQGGRAGWELDWRVMGGSATCR
jgi:hypothetical protein